MATRTEPYDASVPAGPFDKVAYLVALALLAFGQNATAQHESVASLYGYFGSTVILMLFVRLLPPYSSSRWLG